MLRDSISVTKEFPCQSAAVWQKLTSPDSYSCWYMAIDAPVDATLLPGARLHFCGMEQNAIVTVCVPETHLAIATGHWNDEFIIQPTDSGCRVTLSTTGHLAEDMETRALDILEQLRTAVSDGGTTQHAATSRPISGNRLNSFITSLFQGYRNPIRQRRNATETAETLSSVFDGTESDVIIHPRAVFAALLCFILLFSTLSLATRFERSDIVPSSGLSVMESNDINVHNVSLAVMGQRQDDLERMLNCRGLRLSNTEYYYCSVSRLADGTPKTEAYITYDAYGRVRNIIFIDNSQTEKRLGILYPDVSAYLSATMTPAEAAAALDYPLTAFWMDKSGITTIYFGRFRESGTEVGATSRAELVVKLDGVNLYVDSQYYFARDLDNPLESNQLTRLRKLQYTNIEQFIADRDAYQRIFLLLGKMRADADSILGTEGANFAATQNMGIICTYSVRCPVSNESFYRYLYTITFLENGQIVEATFQNRYLEALDDTLRDIDDYNLIEGMSLHDVYRAMGILPSYGCINFDTYTLCFGARGESSKLERRYPIVIEFNLSDMLISNITIND